MAHLLVLANRNAGGGRGAYAAPRLQAALRAAGHSLTLIDEPDREAAGRALATGPAADAIVACGGDGTVHVALQEALRRNVALGIVAAGSGDDCARATGLPHGRRRRHIDAAIAHLVASVHTSAAVDVVRATAANGTSEAYLGVLAAGFDSRVNARANHLRFPPGTAKYVRAMVQELSNFAPINYRLEMPGHDEQFAGMMVAVGNGATYGGGMRVCPGADIRDGLLQVLIVGTLPKLRFLRLFPLVFPGAHVRHPVVRTFEVPQLVLHAPGQDAWADGEYLGPAPVALHVEHLALRVLGAA